MWALGLIGVSMISCKPVMWDPVDNHGLLSEAVALWPSLPLLADVLTGCLKMDPQERPFAMDVVNILKQVACQSETRGVGNNFSVL